MKPTMSADAIADIDAMRPPMPDIPGRAFTARQAAERWGVQLSAAHRELRRRIDAGELVKAQRGHDVLYWTPVRSKRR